MISRKERKIQEALGLGDDIPPTIFKRTQHKWRHFTFYSYKCRPKYIIEQLYWWLAFKLPKRLIYYCVIRVWARTTCGSWSGEDCTATTMADATKRWESLMKKKNK